MEAFVLVGLWGAGGKKKNLVSAARYSGSRKIPAVSGWGLL